MYSSKFIFKSSCLFLSLSSLLLLSTSSKYSRARALISIFTQYVYLNGSDEDGGVVREREKVRFSRAKLTCYWYSLKQPETRQCLARGGVRRISHRARHVDVL